MCTFRYPAPRRDGELFRGGYGPTVRTFEAPDADRRAPFAADLAAHWSDASAWGWRDHRGRAEYLEVVAVRR